MMSRIRTIKPDFFKHEGIFDAEQETGLPLRLAFVGLWTQSDRDGRFAWRPRQLKADIFPYDDVDFSRVLHALATRGFIVKYASGDREFGAIPSWHRHQVINNRESASQIPEPAEIINISDACPTREARVPHAGKAEGKGREGKGKEIEPVGSLSATGADHADKASSIVYPKAFEAFWNSYPTTRNMSKKEAFDAWKKLDAPDREKCALAVPGYTEFLKNHPKLETIHTCRFILKRRFDSYAEPASNLLAAVDDGVWAKRLRYGRKTGNWSTSEWGPRPRQDGSRVPPHLIEDGDGDEWGEMEVAA
jgi:hypothetical protein